MSLLAHLAEEAVSQFGERLADAPLITHDALILVFDSGVTLQARFASAAEYSIHWRLDGTELRIDTAPLHPGLASYPSHLHAADGSIQPDLLTLPGQEPWENLQAVLVTVLRDPLLSRPA